MSETADGWNPEQYNRFRAERQQPFRDLMALIEARPGMRMIDLGCGTGELTRLLHDRLAGADSTGIDGSAAMLAESAAFAAPRLRFVAGDIAGVVAEHPYDLVVSNAALQWLPDHAALFARLRAMLAAGGQLAVQMPDNFLHPSHVVAARVAGEAPFDAALGGFAIERSVQAPEWYAERLHQLGFARQHVRTQIYPHLLESPAAVVEWVKGTLLTAYQRRLPPDLWPAFLERYRTALLAALPDQRPYFYAFRRLLMWGGL